MKNPGYSFTFIINQDVMKPPLYRSYIAGFPFPHPVYLQWYYMLPALTPLVYFITDYSSPFSSTPSIGIYSSRRFYVSFW